MQAHASPRRLIALHACMYALTTSFYWRNLTSVWNFPFEWMGFTIAIILLVLFYLYRKRKVLKSLATISESKGRWGWGFLGLAVLLYLFSSYVGFTLWLRLCSFTAFTTAYLMIMIDFRIAKVLSIPLFSLFFLVPPSFVDGQTWNLFILATLLVIALLFVSTFKTSARLKFLYPRFRQQAEEGGKEDKACPVCNLGSIENEDFCPHCGKESSKPFGALDKRYLIIRFLVLLMIVCILSFTYIPVFSFTDQGARINSHSFSGVEDRQIFSPPVDWLLNSSERLLDYETRYNKEYAVLSEYISQKHYMNELFIMLEVSRGSPFLMDDWNISGWQRIEYEDILLEETVVSQSVVLRDPIGRETMPVLFWKMRLLFRTDSEYSFKRVGVSVFMRFNETLSESLVLDIFDEMKEIGQSMVNRWFLIDRITLHTLTLSQVYTQFGDLIRDLFFIALGVVSLFLFAGWIRTRDEGASRLTELAYLLSNDQAQLLLAASRVEQRKFRGVELFKEYRQVRGKKVDLCQFYGRLRRLLTLGLLRRDYIVDKDNELRMVWVLNLT